MIVRNEDGTLYIIDGVYEPPPLPRHILRRRRYVRLIFAALSIACVIGGALYAINN